MPSVEDASLAEEEAVRRSNKGDFPIALKLSLLLHLSEAFAELSGPKWHCSSELDSNDGFPEHASANELEQPLLGTLFSLLAMKLPLSVSGVAKPRFV